jgi:hypothetical protein
MKHQPYAFPFPAYTYPNGEINHGDGGMKLRDYFAAKAMKEIMAQAYELEQECWTDGDFSFPDTMCSLAKEAYKWADAMLKAREA